MNRYMVFDVESIGLQGEAFAVGYVVVDEEGKELDCGHHTCPPDAARGSDVNRQWVLFNCPPMHADCGSPKNVRDLFWADWMRERERGALMVADCPWPVEARFLASCVDDDILVRKEQGPYPLLDVASVRLAAGFDPLATVERLPTELPKHHPTVDARQSARLFLEALAHIRGTR